MKTALYPGTFDPITNGHLDVLERACRIFDHVIVAIADNHLKQPLFSLEERCAFVEANRPEPHKTSVRPFQSLTVEFARSVGAVATIRGLRAVSDFEYEFQMAQINRFLDSGIETIFLMPSEKHFFLSSGMVREISRFSDKAKHFVPPDVHKALQKKFNAPLTLSNQSSATSDEGT